MNSMLKRGKQTADIPSELDMRKDTAAFFDTVYRRYRTGVFTYCCRFLGDYHDAEDCMQEVFMKAMKKYRSFRGTSSIGTWLYRISVRTCLNRRRSSARYDRMRERITRQNIVDGQTDRYETPEHQLERQTSEDIVRSAVTRLPPARRSVLILRDINGLSYEDIAKITGLNTGTLKSRIARGRRDLADLLRGAL